MYTGMEVISTDLPRTYGCIVRITRKSITVKWERTGSSTYRLDRTKSVLPFEPLADRLLLIPRESFKRDSRDMHPVLLKGCEYEAWDDGTTLRVKSENGYLYLMQEERTGILSLCDVKRDES